MGRQEVGPLEGMRSSASVDLCFGREAVYCQDQKACGLSIGFPALAAAFGAIVAQVMADAKFRWSPGERR